MRRSAVIALCVVACFLVVTALSVVTVQYLHALQREKALCDLSNDMVDVINLQTRALNDCTDSPTTTVLSRLPCP